jgi:hypothetical protein
MEDRVAVRHIIRQVIQPLWGLERLDKEIQEERCPFQPMVAVAVVEQVPRAETADLQQLIRVELEEQALSGLLMDCTTQAVAVVDQIILDIQT